MITLKADKTFSWVLKILILFWVAGIFSCRQKKPDRQIERSFYYWKSVFTLTDYEKQKLDTLQVKTLYIKFFDVDWDEERRRAKPVAKLKFEDPAYQNYKIIPTVFITNACIQKIDSGAVIQLANDITRLIKTIIAIQQSPHLIEEIQIDCDWTASTKEKYFSLLNEIKQLTNVKLSATIRLHQVKFIAKTGIPPVDRGLLMCYNMGNLKDPATKNSIIETVELKKYISGLSNYPLPLDIALPLFDWKVLYRNNVYTGLIQNLPQTVFTSSFTEKKDNRYLVLKDTLLQGYNLRKGDIIRDEQSSCKEILSTSATINKQLKNTQLRVSLYHLDSVILSKYTTHELENIYNSLH